MDVLWKSTLKHPKWLHNDPQVVVKWHRATRIYQKWLQSASKMWSQSGPAQSVIIFLGVLVAPLTPSKML
jgi:hypothetical protein